MENLNFWDLSCVLVGPVGTVRHPSSLTQVWITGWLHRWLEHGTTGVLGYPLRPPQVWFPVPSRHQIHRRRPWRSQGSPTKWIQAYNGLWVGVVARIGLGLRNLAQNRGVVASNVRKGVQRNFLSPALSFLKAAGVVRSHFLSPGLIQNHRVPGHPDHPAAHEEPGRPSLPVQVVLRGPGVHTVSPHHPVGSHMGLPNGSLLPLPTNRLLELGMSQQCPRV